MDRYIGLDVHTQTCTLVVMGPSGRRLRETVIETNGRILIDAIKGIAGDKHVCLEEGTQSNWVVGPCGRTRRTTPRKDTFHQYPAELTACAGADPTMVRPGSVYRFEGKHPGSQSSRLDAETGTMHRLCPLGTPTEAMA